jgi:hypothetical protein
MAGKSVPARWLHHPDIARQFKGRGAENQECGHVAARRRFTTPAIWHVQAVELIYVVPPAGGTYPAAICIWAAKNASTARFIATAISLR